MALLKFAPEIQGIRGHASGLILSANAYGPSVKKFAAPIDPRTSDQQTYRSNLATVAPLWRTITSGQRSDWDDFAAAPPETDSDPWGETVYLTGLQWFIRINTRLMAAGAATVNAPPAAVAATPVTILTLVARDPGHDDEDSYLTFANESFIDGSLPVIHLHLSYSPGIQNPTSRFLQVYCGPTTASFAVLLGDILTTRFGDYPPDTVLFAQLRRQSTTGIRSTSTTKSCTVTV